MRKSQKAPWRFWLVMAAGALSAACGNDGANVASGSNARGVITSSSASLAGTPSTQVTTGQPYSFTPSLTTSSGSFTFSIANKPAWAQFSTATGTLAGTPASSDAGLFTGIVITASNGTTRLALPAFDLAVAAPPQAVGRVTLSWEPPAAYVDGTPMETLAGYVIYHGTSADDLRPMAQVNDPQQMNFTSGDLLGGEHYFGISAFTTAGVESTMSAIGSVLIM